MSAAATEQARKRLGGRAAPAMMWPVMRSSRRRRPPQAPEGRENGTGRGRGPSQTGPTPPGTSSRRRRLPLPR